MGLCVGGYRSRGAFKLEVLGLDGEFGAPSDCSDLPSKRLTLCLTVCKVICYNFFSCFISCRSKFTLYRYENNQK